MNSLYFPDNKLEYIPSLISLAIIILLTILVIRFVIKHSRKEEEKAKALEKKMMDNHSDSSS